MDVDESEQKPITFEEVLLLRMAFELNRSTSNLRTQYYLDALERILPEFREYRAITFAICHMDEPDLPQIDPAVEKIWPYPEGQQGFTRRAILGEWIKFSIQLNVEDEVVRKSLTSLCFELVRRVEYSFSDYEHLLRQKQQLIKASDLENASANTLYTLLKVVTDEDQEADIEELLGQANINLPDSGQVADNQQLEIVIRTFENIGTARSLHEYCKPFS